MLPEDDRETIGPDQRQRRRYWVPRASSEGVEGRIDDLD